MWNTALIFRFREKQYQLLILRNITPKLDKPDGLINQTSDVLTTKAEYSLNQTFDSCLLKWKDLLTLGLLSFSFLDLCGGRSALVFAWDWQKKAW